MNVGWITVGLKEGIGVGLPGVYVGERVGKEVGEKVIVYEMVMRPLPDHTPWLLARMLVHNVLLQ